eukprot:CAMPEP_0116105768 /NCGR_PEP_ID=MMETSP0327-20121206/15233_1 /TAXON_ID=44447 /ORGANISM="Pseudo-nitzschia delicatissima, Strain B596" /LENGTH=311 /DNA_ID=CAMNT_0003598245 /DNA_START=95 /DNA_END=1030 /DNA_ORIENTATION=+
MSETKSKAAAAAEMTFLDISEGPRHSLGITADGRVYSWGNSRASNNLGQLGRDTSTSKKKVTRPGLVEPFCDNHLKAARVFVSNSAQKDSGHSAIIDENGRLWMSGCDRWQQLGLGSANGGASGYTWKGGKLWHDKFILSESITTEMPKKQKMNNSDDKNNIVQRTTSEGTIIRDAALGGDHTLVLSSNKQDVFAFGKCGDGQCGFIGKPYVSAPKRSKLLSSTSSIRSSDSSEDTSNDGSRKYIAAVCAVEACSITIDDDGKVIRKVGKCTPSSKSMSKSSSSSIFTASALSDGIEKCIQNARRRGLINR